MCKFAVIYLHNYVYPWKHMDLLDIFSLFQREFSQKHNLVLLKNALLGI